MQLMAEQLMADAVKGNVLEAEERRHVIAWLMSQGSIQTNDELAEIFHVTPRTITTDRSKIREMMAETIKHEDVALILADIKLTFDRNIRDLEKSKKKCKLGTTTYMQHCVAICKLQADFMKSFQDLGVYPKELGTLQVANYDFKATVGLSTGDSGRTVGMFDNSVPPTITGEVVEAKALTNGANSSGESVRSTTEGIGHTTDGKEQSGEPSAPASA